jgi:hypothetical protein
MMDCPERAVHFDKMVTACGVEASEFAPKRVAMDMAVGRM